MAVPNPFVCLGCKSGTEDRMRNAGGLGVGLLEIVVACFVGCAGAGSLTT